MDTALTQKTKTNIVDIHDKIIDIYNKNREMYLNMIRLKIYGYGSIEEDILHDVFVKILLKDEEVLNNIANLNAFIIVSIKNKIIDLYRTKAEDKKVMVSFSDIERISKLSPNSTIEDVLFYFITDKTKLHQQENITSELFEYVYRAMDTVPKEQLETFILNKFEGLTLKEISEKQGVKINTALARNRYARLKIRNFIINELEGELFDFPEIN